jgi:Tol biopolymer transport system component
MRTAAVLTTFAALVLAAPAGAVGITERVNLDSGEGQAAGGGISADISADGRYVAFLSGAANLVPGDTNNTTDAFVRDRQTGETERVSVNSDEGQANSRSGDVAISADGRYVAFMSDASNLVAGDTNAPNQDVFVRDRQTGETERVSVDSAEGEANSYSVRPAISGDGRYVTFTSAASNLVAGDTSVATDIFVRDRETGETERVSINSGEGQANEFSDNAAITPDGRYVVFASLASNLVAGDTNADLDVFVRDRVTGETERVSVSSGEGQANGFSDEPALSADGRYVAFASFASNLVAGDTSSTDIFVRDRQTGETERVSVDSAEGQANGLSLDAAISADGRYVGFTSAASNLVAGDTNANSDVFLRDRHTGETERVSVDSGERQANGASGRPAISADGRYVSFSSLASNLVAGDTNDRVDVFVRDRAGVALVAGAQQPVNADGSSTFNANRGVIPLKFTLTDDDGSATCELPPATLRLTRSGGALPGPIDEGLYTGSPDSGTGFRITDCRYHYNLSPRPLGPGTYLAEVLIGGLPAGEARFELK